MARTAPSLSLRQLGLILASFLLAEPLRWAINRWLDDLADNPRLPWASQISAVLADAQPFVIGGAVVGFALIAWGNHNAIATTVGHLWRPRSADQLKALPDKVFAPTITQSEPLKLTIEEAERRIKAVDDMYEVLNKQGAGVCEAGQKLAGPIRDLVFNDGPADVNAGLRVWRGQVSDLVKAIRGVQHRHSLQESVYPPSLFDFEFEPCLNKALDEISGDIGLLARLNEKITRNHVLLIESRILPFQKAVNVLEEWLVQQKKQLKNTRDALVRAAPLG